jgi:hypothetical protein
MVDKYTGFDFSLRSTSLSVAASFSASTLFTLKTSLAGSCYALVFEAVVNTDYRRADDSDISSDGLSRIVWRKGCGLQMRLRVERKAAGLSTNIFIVTAESELKDSKVNYEFSQRALDPLTTLAITTIPLGGELDANLLGILDEALTKRLPEYLESDDVKVHEYSTIEPVREADEKTCSRLINYVMSTLAEGKTVKQAVEEKPDDIEALDVQVTYSWLEADLGPEEISRRASMWLGSGSTTN